MRGIVTSLIIIVNFVMQSTIFEHIKFRGIKPDSLIIVAVSTGILRGSSEGALVGFFTGLIQDMFYGSSLGYYGLIHMFIGYLCGIPYKNFFRENFLLPLLFTAVSSFIKGIYVYVSGFLINGKLDFLYYFNNIIIPEVVYTSIFSLLLYRVLYAINLKIEKREYRKRKMF